MIYTYLVAYLVWWPDGVSVPSTTTVKIDFKITEAAMPVILKLIENDVRKDFGNKISADVQFKVTAFSRYEE